jgi:hypothetical protein
MMMSILRVMKNAWAVALVFLFCPGQSEGQVVDFEYGCVVVATPSAASSADVLPVGVDNISVGDTFYIEFWATDLGDTNTGIVCAYSDLAYPEGCASVVAIECDPVFSLFCSGDDANSLVDELGACQLQGGVGIEPEWVRIAHVEFVADVACNPAAFQLLPAHSESSAHNRGLIPTDEIGYGACSVVISEISACCLPDATCAEGMTEEDCASAGGRNLGDGSTCNSDPDQDGVVGCDDQCPSMSVPAGVDEHGRPLGDLDGDCDVDLVDFGTFQANFTGVVP